VKCKASHTLHTLVRSDGVRNPYSRMEERAECRWLQIFCRHCELWFGKGQPLPASRIHGFAR